MRVRPAQAILVLRTGRRLGARSSWPSVTQRKIVDRGDQRPSVDSAQGRVWSGGPLVQPVLRTGGSACRWLDLVWPDVLCGVAVGGPWASEWWMRWCAKGLVPPVAAAGGRWEPAGRADGSLWRPSRLVSVPMAAGPRIVLTSHSIGPPASPLNAGVQMVLLHCRSQPGAGWHGVDRTAPAPGPQQLLNSGLSGSNAAQ
jgi:hypothetical protein